MSDGNLPVLGRLASVQPREVWPHEALHFTPWLLANVDVLSDLLGMDLELTVAEHPVGGFSLDLLGRDSATGETVIVENQLETSDHTHLGQILTYAAGTDPTTIVWLAASFRPEHRAAIDWLNNRTDENTRFFGVEIGVVRIADSQPAPAFTLVAQPNDWQKVVRTATAASVTPKQDAYLHFWQLWIDRLQVDRPTWSRSKKSTVASWFSMPAGADGAIFSAWFTKRGVCSALEFDDRDGVVNTARFGSLSARRTEFEAAYGRPVEWEELPGRKSTRVAEYLSDADVMETDRWTFYLDWLIDAQTRLRTALAAVGGLPPR